MVWPAVAALAPPLIAGAASMIGQERANRANLRIAREQMRFQERMSGTAWQRAVKDMRLAGINPMLAYQQGGASSPSGQTARMEDVIGPAVSSAMNMMRMRKELKLLTSQEYKARMDAYKSMAEGSYVNTQNMIAGAGTLIGSKIEPYEVTRRRLANQLIVQQKGLTKAQAQALKFSPFLTRFVGTESPMLMRKYVFPKFK